MKYQYACALLAAATSLHAQMPPTPDAAKQKEIIAQIRENALSYTDGLPNFICSQVTERSTDPTGSGDHWTIADRIQEQLTFFEHREKYKVVAVNGRMVTNVEHRKLGGVRSEGEFGSMLNEIFDPRTQTTFEWQRFGKWHGTITHVIAYSVTQPLSHYNVRHDPTGREAIVGYHGVIHADVKTNVVTHITMDCDMPADFPIQQVSLVLDYDPQRLADREFILPSRYVLTSREGHLLSKNSTEFRLYHKYSAEETITFETDDPKPPVKKQP